MKFKIVKFLNLIISRKKRTIEASLKTLFLVSKCSFLDLQNSKNISKIAFTYKKYLLI